MATNPFSEENNDENHLHKDHDCQYNGVLHHITHNTDNYIVLVAIMLTRPQDTKPKPGSALSTLHGQ